MVGFSVLEMPELRSVSLGSALMSTFCLKALTCIVSFHQGIFGFLLGEAQEAEGTVRK